MNAKQFKFDSPELVPEIVLSVIGLFSKLEKSEPQKRMKYMKDAFKMVKEINKSVDRKEITLEQGKGLIEDIMSLY